MRQKTVILYNESNESLVDNLQRRYLFDRKIYSQDLELTEEILSELVKTIAGSFYVIKTNKKIIFDDFNFSFEAPVWDQKYVHIWNNDSTIRLFHAEHVRQNPGHYTDQEMYSGRMEMKLLSGKIYSYPLHDIIFLSYDESYADSQFAKLNSRFPRAARVHGIKGILDAHVAAAKKARSDLFYVVDADAEVLPSFEFDFQPNAIDLHSVHVWHSRNPVNGLEYGYGGVKLFPRQALLDFKGSPVDFTTSVASGLKVIPEVSNITRFNTDPFSAWRSAFRECAKLSSKIIHNQDNTETEQRLNIWCSVGENEEFGDFAVMGAREGREFGLKYADKPEIRLINDFAWLEKRFSES